MTDTTRDLGADVEALRDALRALEGRVRGLEETVRAPRPVPAGAVAAAAAVATPLAAEAGPAGPPAELLRAIPLVGRLLLVLGGAYVLRALTEGGTLPVAAGAAAAYAYAFAWVAASARAARAGLRMSALFHALGAALVAFPLLLETATRFELLAPPLSAVAVGAVVLSMLAVAAVHGAQGVAWVGTLGALASGLFLMVRPGGAGPHAALLVLLALGTRQVGRARHWPALAWPPALAAAGAAAFLTDAATPAPAGVAPAAALVLQLLLAGATLAAVSVESVRTGRRPGTLDLVSTGLVLAFGLGGALRVAASTDSLPLPLASACLAAGLAGYVVAFRRVPRASRGPYLYLTSVSLVVVLLSSLALLARPAVPWAAAGALASFCGSRWRRVVLTLHGTVYAAAAAVASGLLATSLRAWTAPAAEAWPSLTAPAVLALGAVALCAWFTVRADNPFWREVALLPKLVCTVLLAMAGGGAVVLLLAGPLAGVPGPGGDAATLAVLRTAVLSLATVACAWIARTEHLRLARWLVYPVLALGAVKLLLEDLSHGTPAALAVSFVLYGSALILAPRIARRRPSGPAVAAPAPTDGTN